MASNGGGFGRFARGRKQTDAPVKAPAPPEPRGENPPLSPANDFTTTFGGFDTPGGGADTFGTLFNMDFDMDGKTSYEYNDFENSQPDSPSDETTAAVGGMNPTQSTIPSQESTMATPVMTNKSNASGGGGGPFQLRNNNNQGMNTHVSPPRPKTAAPPQQQAAAAPAGGNKSGLSMFARKRAPSQESTNTAQKMTADTHTKSLEPTGVPTTTPAPVEKANSNNDDSRGATESTPFQRVLPPPSIPPATEPLHSTIPSTTPEATGFMPSLSTETSSFATPMLRTSDKETSLMPKTGNDMSASFVTPEATATTNPALSSTNKNETTTMHDSLLQDHSSSAMTVDSSSFAGSSITESNASGGFDDLLSAFMQNVRSSTDICEYNQTDTLDQEVDLSRVFYVLLNDRAHAMDLVDGMLQDFDVHSSDVLVSMRDF